MIILTAGLCWAYVLGEVCAIVSDMNEETQATANRAGRVMQRSFSMGFSMGKINETFMGE